MLPEPLRLKLEKLAARSCWSDDEDATVDDFAAGNIDDAFAGGCTEGEILLAREILEAYPR